jgi:hypothetical protein
MVASVSEKDADILRRLGEQIHTIGSLPIQAEKAELWRRLNDREPVRPMVYINEEPWPELANEEMACLCEDESLHNLEWNLRAQLYRWNHCPVDMIIKPEIEVSKAWSSTGIGIQQKTDQIGHETCSSSHFIPQICDMKDIEKIQMPVVSIDNEESERRLAFFKSIFEGVVPVSLTGPKTLWFTPWDNLIRLVPMEGIMMDMIDRPEFVDALVSRYVDALMLELDQIEALGILTAGADNTRVGSGGYGYTKDLPIDDGSGSPSPCDQLWGCGNAQIFTEVSPQMHWDFSLKHEQRWLDRWGMTYYGCCEPLHFKIDILRKIKNLRKISVSPWFDIPKGLEMGAGDYVLSVKNNPAIFAEDRFNEERARQEIATMLDQAEGANVELVMKDITTVRNDPSRLWRWAEIALEEAEKRG